jgi:hypothetical protein
MLGEDVRQLIFRRDKLDLQKLLCNMFSHKMIINFDVFRSGMKYQIRGEICSADVVTPKDRRSRLRNSQLAKQRLHPYDLSCSIGHNFIFSFSTTPRNCSLFASTPGDQIRTKEYSMSPRGSPVIRITSPIRIR